LARPYSGSAVRLSGPIFDRSAQHLNKLVIVAVSHTATAICKKDYKLTLLFTLTCIKAFSARKARAAAFSLSTSGQALPH
jgi:hypothetical protein